MMPFNDGASGSTDVPEARQEHDRPHQNKRRYYIYVDDDEGQAGEVAQRNNPPEAKKKANPAPLGLLGFGMTTVLLNVHNTGYYPLTTTVLGMGIWFGGLAQLITGILEYFGGNTFAYVAYFSYGSFWLSTVCIFILPNKSLLEIYAANEVDPYSLGIYFILWGIFTFIMSLCSLRTNLATMTVFFTLTLLFVLLAAGNMGNSPTTVRVAGFEGIFCGSSALYLAFAEVINETYGRELVPVVPVERLCRKKNKADTENINLPA